MRGINQGPLKCPAVAMALALMVVGGRADTLLLSDNFDTVNNDASTFNNTLATDQGGTLATVSYTLAGWWEGWQIQHSNGGVMLLAGGWSGYGADLRASLNRNFAADANTADKPLRIQFLVKVSDASDASNWATIAVGSTQNAFVNDGANKFSSLFRRNGGTQQFASGGLIGETATFNPAGSTVVLILSDTAGTGSPFDGNGSVARFYIDGSLVGLHTLAQLSADDGYISFQANGALGHYDNLSVQLREVVNFDGYAASDTTTHVINATDWADYVGGVSTFNSANDWGRLYWRGSAGDGQYLHFDLSALSGKTVVSPAYITLQNGNATWLGGVDGSFVAAANGAWTAGAGQPVPGATPIGSAVNASGSYGNGASVSWGVGSAPLQSLVDNPASNHGLAVIGGAGSQLHFSGPMSPYLTVKTGTLSGALATGVITVSGGDAWNGGSYSFNAGDGYSAAAALRITGTVAGGTSGAGNVTINGGNVLVQQPGGAYNYYWAVDSTTINAGGLLTANGHTHIHNLTLAGGELGGTAVDGTYGGWTFDDATTVTGGTTSTVSARQVNLDNGNITVGAGSILNFTGPIRSGSLTKLGAGSMVLSGYSTYTGDTTVNGGVLEISGASGGRGLLRGDVIVNAEATLTLTGGDGTGFGWNNPISSLTVNGGTVSAGSAHIGFGNAVAVALNNGGTITGSWQWNGDSLLSFSASGDSTSTVSGTLVLRSDAGANHTFTVADGAAALDLQIDAALSDQYPEVGWVPASAFIKAGPGTLALTGNNTFDGATTVSGGTLSLVTGRLYTSFGWGSATVTVHGGGVLEVGAWGDGGSQSAGGLGQLGFAAANLVLDGGTVRYSAIAADSGDMDRQFVIGAGGATLDANSSAAVFTLSNTRWNVIADNNRSLTLAGAHDGLLNTPFGGSGGLTKTGAGTWTLSAANTYTGTTTVNAGTLRLGADNTLDADNNVVLAGGALDGGGFSNQLGTLAVTGAGSLVLGAGSLRFLDSYALAWPGTLTLTGTLGPTTVRFGNSHNALTAEQLQKISLNGSPVDLDAGGYLYKASQGTVFIVK